jgi:hypothetical protein
MLDDPPCIPEQFLPDFVWQYFVGLPVYYIHCGLVSAGPACSELSAPSTLIVPFGRLRHCKRQKAA